MPCVLLHGKEFLLRVFYGVFLFCTFLLLASFREISSTAGRLFLGAVTFHGLCREPPCQNHHTSTMTQPQKPTQSNASPPPPPVKSLLSRSAEGAKFLILLQVSSRLLTFGVNQLLLRYLSPSLLGISVQLELLTISILYFSRESLRNALQRSASDAGGRSVQVVVNIAHLTVPLGVLFSALLGSGYILRAGESGAVRYWRESVGLYVLATLLELAAEPAFAVAQMRMWYKLRAAAESAAAAARCIVTCGVTVWGVNTRRELGALPFALGQLAYGGVLLAVYLQRMWREGVKVGLKKIEGGGRGKDGWAFCSPYTGYH